MNYKNKFAAFVLEVHKLPEAKTAIFTLSKEILNCVIITGEIIGKNTYNNLIQMGEKHGLLLIADNLSIMFIESEIRSENVSETK